MKTILELPDALFWRAKSAAAQRGIPLRQLVSEALAEKLTPVASEGRPWMRAFGKLRVLRTETAKINRTIKEEFDILEPEDRQ